MSLAIEVSDLWKIYENPRVEALRGVTLRVESGRCLGILGPNGSGKTTLVEIIQGVRSPTRGKVSVFGMQYAADEARIRSRIGGILQDNGTWSRLRAIEILDLFACLYAKPASVSDLAERFKLQPLLHRPLNALSGGERQRIFLALALVGNPEMVFLDEPTTGLDPRVRRDFWSYISALKSDGKTVILTTHYLEEAEALCDEIVVVKGGTILAQGTPKELSLRTARERGDDTARSLNEIYLAITDDGEI
jgi:ABC-2 type transport system ATP-binding protein